MRFFNFTHLKNSTFAHIATWQNVLMLKSLKMKLQPDAPCDDNDTEFCNTHKSVSIFRKEHTDSLLQSSALLSQFDGMNIAEWSLITQHFTVDGSHHELLHLPLKSMTQGRHFNTHVNTSRYNSDCLTNLVSCIKPSGEKIHKDPYHGGVRGWHLFFDRCQFTLNKFLFLLNGRNTIKDNEQNKHWVVRTTGTELL